MIIYSLSSLTEVSSPLVRILATRSLRNQEATKICAMERKHCDYHARMFINEASISICISHMWIEWFPLHYRVVSVRYFMAPLEFSFEVYMWHPCLETDFRLPWRYRLLLTGENHRQATFCVQLLQIPLASDYGGRSNDFKVRRSRAEKDYTPS